MADKDPNDPAQRLSRAEAMAVVRKNAMREKLVKDIAPAEQAEALASFNLDSDDPLEVSVAPAPQSDANLDPGTQVDRQTATPMVLADSDLGRYQVRYKVNGEERVVTVDELRAHAQKNDAADSYLREAKEQARQILEGAKSEAAKLAAAPAPAAPAAPVATTTSTETQPQVNVEDMVDTAIDSLFKGNEEEAKRLLKTALLAGRPATPAPAQPSVNVDELAAQVEAKATVRSALRRFAKEYPAIMDDPIARGVADRFLTEETAGKPLEAFPEERISEILAATGKRVVDWTRGISGVPADAPPATTRDEKEAKKEAIDELPAAHARAHTHVPPPQTASDVIMRMKAARGQLRDPTQPTS